MEAFTVCLDAATARFYHNVAENAGLNTEQVLRDALFKLAGELSLQALAGHRSKQHLSIFRHFRFPSDRTLAFATGFDIMFLLL